MSVILTLTPTCVSAQRSVAGYPNADISIENLRQTVGYLSAIVPPRTHSNRQSLAAAAAYIGGRLAESGLKPQRQRFEVSGQHYENVIASVGPRDGPRIVVGAHYDVCGDQPGADDNASGVAGMLEVARVVKRLEPELTCRVDFVAYTLEEPPFFGTENMGSYVHAKSLRDNNVAVRGMICLEMIGFFSNRAESQTYPLSVMRWFYPDTGDFIGVVGNITSASLAAQVSQHLEAAAVKVETLRAPSFISGVDFSDHRNYWHFGYKAVMVTDTAFYRNPHYHRPSDSMETLDYERMQAVVKGVCWALLNRE